MPEKKPNHIAVIMDGNGRWARQRGWRRLKGHEVGMQALSQLVEHAVRLQLSCLTLFAFSRENWCRPPDEISHILHLLKLFVATKLTMLLKNNIRVRVVGAREDLPDDIEELFQKLEQETALNTGLQLVLAFNYSGQDEIVRATKRIISQVEKGKLKPEAIDKSVFSSYLDTAGLDDPDLIIRTSGELRLSNFFLWQSAYAELYFSSVLWPDFSPQHLEEAIKDYSARQRRFGCVEPAYEAELTREEHANKIVERG